MVKNLPAMQETWIRFLGQEDPQKRAWQPTPVLLPEESHGWRSLEGYSPLSHKASDTTELSSTQPDPEHQFGSVQSLSRVQLFPGLPVHHSLPQFTQTHGHRVGDAIQPSHPLSSPSPPAPNPSQHEDLFHRVNSSHRVAKVLEFQLQHQSFQ